jgi:hypothetical protein
MNTLIELIEQLPPSQWDYYNSVEDQPAIVYYKPFSNKITHRNFIRRYFKRAGKGSVLEQHFSIKNIPLKRCSHTNSIFFLGLIIYYNTKLKHHLFQDDNSRKYNMFPFLWFLTCLFHDTGYHYENNKEYHGKLTDVSSVKNHFSIDHDLLSLKNVTGVPESLTSNIEKYYLFRVKESRKIDHGIIAGLFLYDRLIKNRQLRAERSDDKFYWGAKLDKDYELVAATIACHNIWLSNNGENSKVYRNYGLNTLIDHNKIILEDSPLLFMLGLVDTIDPVKLFNAQNPKTVLNNILIGFQNNLIKISSIEKSWLDFSKLKKKCFGLMNWLDIDVKCDGNCNSVNIII